MNTVCDWPMAQVTSLYPSLKEVQPGLAELQSSLQPMVVPAHTELFSENAACQGFPLVIEGEIKVSRHSGDGRSLELYRVVPGELCLVSSARNAALLRMVICSRPNATQPSRSKRRSRRVTISRTVPSSSASAWCVRLRCWPRPSKAAARRRSSR